MQIKFIGTGGAFDYKYGNSSAILTLDGERVLVDAGNQVYSRLREKNAIEGIDSILITHFHDDHVGSLSSIILHHHHFLHKNLKLYHQTGDFGDQLYAFLKFSLQKPEGFVDFVPLDHHENITFIDTKNLHIPGLQSYGFVFSEEGENMAYSGDLGDGDILFYHLRERGLKQIPVFHELTFHEANKAHVHYKKLEKYHREFEIYGYHIDPSKEPRDNKIPLVANQPQFML